MRLGEFEETVATHLHDNWEQNPATSRLSGNAVAGIDIATGEVLDGDERFDRTVMGAGAIGGIFLSGVGSGASAAARLRPLAASGSPFAQILTSSIPVPEISLSTVGQFWRTATAEPRRGMILNPFYGRGMAVSGAQRLRSLGLEGVNLTGKSFNSGRKALENAGFYLDRITQTGRKVFINAKTGTEVLYDSRNALAVGQKPHWHIRDRAGQGYSRSGRLVGSDEIAGHIPAK